MTGAARHLWSNESGATIAEHAILICVVALVIVAFIGSGLSPSAALRSLAYIAGSILGSGKDAQVPVLEPAGQ